MAKIQIDNNGNKIVVIDAILFKGKRKINWDDVKEYTKKLVGMCINITGTKDIVYIGNDFPNEYTGSEYTYSLKGAAAKAKANISQGIPELLEIAKYSSVRANDEEKHNRNAKFGWYRYTSRFALPVFDKNGEAERYNVFGTSLLVRHDENGKYYLYDIIDIKKETGNPLEP